MRSFEQFPKKIICPICKTNDNKESVLIPISGKEEGNNCQAKCFHLECIDLWYLQDKGVLIQKFDKEVKKDE